MTQSCEGISSFEMLPYGEGGDLITDPIDSGLGEVERLVSEGELILRDPDEAAWIKSDPQEYI